MPNQMSYAGGNLDSVTGSTAIVVAWLRRLSAPRRTPGHTWLAFPPFIWLLSVMVVAAMAGSIIVWERCA